MISAVGGVAQLPWAAISFDEDGYAVFVLDWYSLHISYAYYIDSFTYLCWCPVHTCSTIYDLIYFSGIYICIYIYVIFIFLEGIQAGVLKVVLV
ncbi:hypothetical protein T492DRAFT_946661 [Pavlovales sp. CCMP2436]|nr:hypothetical protein T492DRAFT_946661 [Pavlovales sp. CCMP2436]